MIMINELQYSNSTVSNPLYQYTFQITNFCNLFIFSTVVFFQTT